MKRFEALIGWASEACADSIEDAEGLDLTAIGLLVDDHRRVNIGSILLPVGDLVVDEIVAGRIFSPFALFDASKTILNALLCSGPINFSMGVSAPRTIFINHRVALRVDPLHILPPFLGLVLFTKVFPHAQLSDIFEHNIAALDVGISGFDGAVSSASKAIII